MIVETDDLQMIETMKAMAAHFEAELIVKNLGDGKFSLFMNDEDKAKMPSSKLIDQSND